MILETAVFKTRIGNTLHVSGRSLARVSCDDDLGARRHVSNCSYLSRFAGMFSPDLKANTRAG